MSDEDLSASSGDDTMAEDASTREGTDHMSETDRTTGEEAGRALRRPTRREFLWTGVATGVAGVGVGYLAKRELMEIGQGVIDSAQDAWSCRGEQNDTEGRFGDWNPKKHPENPIIPGTSQNFAQAYPPTVVRVDGRFHAIVKSWPDLVGFSSHDGVHWREHGKVLTPGPAAWDGGKLSNPLLRYDPGDERYHLYYSGVGEEGVAVGHATSDRPTSGYEKDEANPIYDGKTLGRDLGVPAGRAHLSDIVRVDGDFVFYGASQYPESDDRVWVGRGDTWTDVTATTIMFDESDDEVAGEWIQTPQILRYGSTYLMEYTAGRLGRDVRGERELHAAYGDAHDSFTPASESVLTTGPCGAWDERRVYAAQWLKEQDGEYLDPVRIDGSVRLYYSGHDLGTSKLTGNLGLTGLAEYRTLPNGPRA